MVSVHLRGWRLVAALSAGLNVIVIMILVGRPLSPFFIEPNLRSSSESRSIPDDASGVLVPEPRSDRVGGAGFRSVLISHYDECLAANDQREILRCLESVRHGVYSNAISSERQADGVRLLLQSGDGNVVEDVVAWVSRSSLAGSELLEEDFLKLFDHPEARVRSAIAAWSPKVLRHSKEVSNRLESATMDPDVLVAKNAIISLVHRFGDKGSEAREAALRMFDREEWLCRAVALSALSEMEVHGVDLERVISAGLTDPDVVVRREAKRLQSVWMR